MFSAEWIELFNRIDLLFSEWPKKHWNRPEHRIAEKNRLQANTHILQSELRGIILQQWK